tara:strand:+ start:90 stop:449 length:360 start_codon:yes stop_codon:yes gene_type:complete
MENDKFGDFEEIKEESSEEQEEPQVSSRVRLPKKKELLGVITQRLGGNRMEVTTTDGKRRNCRVPGRYRRRLWLRPKNVVIIVPWEYDDGKGDVIYKYRPNEERALRKRGLLDSINVGF